MNAAAILVPPDVLLDGTYAQSCRAYANRRGYPEPTFTRSWNAANKLLLANAVQVVIVAQCEQPAARAGGFEVDDDPGLTTVTILANWRGGRNRGRHRAGRWWSNRRAMPPATAEQLIADAVRRWKRLRKDSTR